MGETRTGLANCRHGQRQVVNANAVGNGIVQSSPRHGTARRRRKASGSGSEWGQQPAGNDATAGPTHRCTTTRPWRNSTVSRPPLGRRNDDSPIVLNIRCIVDGMSTARVWFMSGQALSEFLKMNPMLFMTPLTNMLQRRPTRVAITATPSAELAQTRRMA